MPARRREPVQNCGPSGYRMRTRPRRHGGTRRGAGLRQGEKQIAGSDLLRAIWFSHLFNGGLKWQEQTAFMK